MLEQVNEGQCQSASAHQHGRGMVQERHNLPQPPSQPIIPSLYREWLQAREDWYAALDQSTTGNWDTAACQDADTREYAAFDRMIETAPQSMEDIAALAALLWTICGPHSRRGTEQYEDECQLPGSRLIKAIWNAASGKKGVPVTRAREIV